MSESSARPGPQDRSMPLVMTLAGVIVGLVLFIAFGTGTSQYGAIPFVVGGGLVGAIAAMLLARRKHRIR